MKLKRAFTAAGISLLMVASLAGCGSSDSSSTTQVAATVNGENLEEQTVTDYIQSYREYAGYSDDADWAQFMVDYSYTASDLREQVINYFAQRMVIEQAASNAGVSIDDSTVDDQINSIREAYGYTDDDDWNSLLESMGYSADEYKQEVYYSLLQQALYKQEVPDHTLTDDELKDYIASYGSQYTGKKSSMIEFATTDTDTANSVLAQLQSSTDLATDFAAAAKQYSTDDTSKADGGNVGWDSVETLDSDYTTALDALSVGQLSGVVTGSNGLYIIYCTEEWTAPTDAATVDLTTIPSDILSEIKTAATQQYWSTDCSTYASGLQSDADIQINDMPEGLAYDVDTSNVTPTASSTSSTSSSSSSTSTSSSSSSSSSSTSSTSSAS